MLAAERRNLILEKVHEEKKVIVSELSKEFDVSEETIRRDLDKLEELCYYIKNNSLCGLGQTAPNPVLSTLRYFRDEYEAHIKEKRCPAGVCKALLSYVIDRDKCRGCTLCARNCPAGAIIGSVKNPHIIDTEKCVKCGACMEKCKFGAISKR